MYALDHRSIRVVHAPMTHDDELRSSVDRWTVQGFQFLPELEVRSEQIFDTCNNQYPALEAKQNSPLLGSKRAI